MSTKSGLTRQGVRDLNTLGPKRVPRVLELPPVEGLCLHKDSRGNPTIVEVHQTDERYCDLCGAEWVRGRLRP